MNLFNKKTTIKWKSSGYVTKVIEKHYEDRVKSFHSEILPDELPNDLPIHLFDYFCKSFVPIAKFIFPVEYSNKKKSKRIIIHDGDKKSLYYKHLVQSNVFDYNKINNIEDLINISKNYDIVFLDCENPIVNIFGIEYNKQIKEKFYYLNNIKLSPLRYKTNDHKKYVVELSKFSIRETCLRLLSTNSTEEYKSKRKDLYYEYEFVNIYINHDQILPWFTKFDQDNYRFNNSNFSYINYSIIYFFKKNSFAENLKEFNFTEIIEKYSLIFEKEKLKNRHFWEFCLSQTIQLFSHTIEDYKILISIVKKSNLNIDAKNYILEIILRSLIQLEPSFSYENKIAIASNWEENLHGNAYTYLLRKLGKVFSTKKLDFVTNRNCNNYQFNFENEYARLINLFYKEDDLKDVPKVFKKKELLYNYLLGLIQMEGISIFNVLYSESFYLKHGKILKNKLKECLTNIDITKFYNYDIGLILLLFGCKEINAKNFIDLSMLPDAIPNLKFSGRTYIIDEIIQNLVINDALNIHFRILTILKFYQLDEQHNILLKKIYDSCNLNDSNLYWRKIYSDSTFINGYNFTNLLLNDPYLTSLCHFSNYISNHNKNLICH